VDGFAPHSVTDDLVEGIFLRRPQELGDRPVYEVENGGQFLFWLGTIEDDTREAMHKHAGSWVFADRLGAEPKSDECWAYCEDPATTPDMIKAQWMVLRNGEWIIDELKLDVFEEKYEEERMSALKNIGS